MAVAGINNVSVLETSYINENYSPVSRRWGNQERPISRTSYIRKMWRDLEGENRIKETEKQQTSGATNSNFGSRCSCSSAVSENEYVSITTSETENECPPDQNQMMIENREQDNVNLCVDRAPAISVADKERVRQVFREWGSKNRFSNCSKDQQFCENVNTRVLTVREWLESNTLEQQAPEIGSQIERVQNSGFNHTRVGTRRSVRGRQDFLDLLARFKMEREKEMQSLNESRLVTHFAHRNRIQALLRGRFLWNQRFTQDEKSSSTAASELGLLRQTNTVSDLRKELLSRVNSHEHTHDGSQSDISSLSSPKYRENYILNHIHVNEFETISNTRGTQSETVTENCTSPREYSAPVVERHEQIVETEPHQPSPTESVDQEGSQHETFDHLIFSEEGSVKAEEDSLTFQEDSVQSEEDNLTMVLETARGGSPEPYNEWCHHHPVYASASASDDDSDNILDLHQLASRRRVSNLLESDFRVTLEHLTQSYLERQNQSTESDEETVNEDDDVTESAHSTPTAIHHHSGTECETINGLRIDMLHLQERMNNMQSTLEACMNMQLQLQTSLQQEVSSALTRVSASGESNFQSCFICCDFDSSPNRREHVYVCSNCAQKINWSKVKESIRHP